MQGMTRVGGVQRVAPGRQQQGLMLASATQVRPTEADAEGRPQLSVRGVHEPHFRVLHHRPQTSKNVNSEYKRKFALLYGPIKF